MKKLKVAGKSAPSKVAYAIVKNIADFKESEIITIGAGATNQAVKAIAIARNMMAEQKKDLYCVPGFGTTIINGQEITVLKLLVKPCKVPA